MRNLQCLIGFHAWGLDLDPGRVALTCRSCGKSSVGWTWIVRPSHRANVIRFRQRTKREEFSARSRLDARGGRRDLPQRDNELTVIRG